MQCAAEGVNCLRGALLHAGHEVSGRLTGSDRQPP
jgi:hypothetical protein